MRPARLSWNMGADGVVEVSATDSEGRMFSLLDIYRRPLIERGGMEKTEARDFQITVAERLCNGWNARADDLVGYVARRMLSDMEDHGGVEDFCEKLCGFPEQYLRELAAGAIDCIGLSDRLKKPA